MSTSETFLMPITKEMKIKIAQRNTIFHLDYKAKSHTLQP